MEDETLVENPRSKVHSLPSDYSDVSSGSYDPDFISDISHRMQVPDRIGMDPHQERVEYGQGEPVAYRMSVPDRIIVAGEEQHIGLKGGLQRLDFENVRMDADALNYVGLITPPRTLTLEERFPHVEDQEEKKAVARNHHANGLAPVPPFTPGNSPNDTLLLNEEDDATLLRTQVAKLTRRVTVLEQDGQRRSQREQFIYPLVLGYFIFKAFLWFFRVR